MLLKNKWVYFVIYLSFYSLIFYDLNVILGANPPLLSLSIFIIGISFSVRMFLVYYKINWLHLLHIGSLYFLYLVFDYWMKMTFHLNVEAFHWYDFDKNGFIQYNGLIATVVILAICVSYRMFQQYRGKIYCSIQSRNYEILLSQLFTYFIMTGSQMTLIIKENSYLKLYNNQKILNQKHLFIYSLIAYILISVFSYYLVQAGKAIKKKKANFALLLTTSILLAGIFNYTVQAGLTDKGDWFGTYLASGATFFQIMVFTFLFIGIYGVTNRYILGTLINVTLGVIISIVNSVKFSMRHEPFLPADLTWLKEIGTVARFANINIGLVINLFILITAIIIVFSYRFQILSDRLFKSRIQQVTVVLLVVGFFIGMTNAVLHSKELKKSGNIPLLSSIDNLQNLHWLEIYFGLSANSRFQSVSYIWFKQLTRENMEMPSDYSKQEMGKIVEKYRALAEQINNERTSNISDQTVIYILSESFSDPRRLEGIQSTRDILPNISTILNENTSGLMKSDSYGGGTANMEFQALTGLPKYNLSSYVYIMNSELAPNLKVFPSISNHFEDRFVVHLASGNNYSRRSMYSQLGFNTQVFLEEKGKDSTVQNMGAHPSDESTYNKVLNQLSTSKNQFFSVLTMQNHSPWYYYEPEHLIVTGEHFTDIESGNLLSYSRLLYQTDQATKSFLDELSNVDKKITVVFYGDHLPGLYPKTTFEKNPESQFLTDYFIWSNFETPKLDYPLVNSSDFTALLFEQTNAKVSPYYALLTDVLHKASVDKKELDEEGRQIAEDLRLVEYDIVAGKGYLSREFFEIPQ
ncbi:hypothetical protein BU200_03990 [Streptococcus acidominimus]|uniref:Phosphoglycerol transferase n=2 Tax=Streptococcus acidominimus TaxID=1326 RepID=A0A1Q8EE24_STRAI|nr:hypothetical protein BU200_03990 [Streptococcus acidominimus]SUN08055.1 phosphoglycerol transferase [Streptococcus acidominimus]